MIIDIRCAYSGVLGDIEIYIDEKIEYFAKIGKKVRLYNKSSDVLLNSLKKSPVGKAFIGDCNRKKAISVLRRKDSRGKIYYGLRPKDENRVFRVQTFSKDGVKYLLFTEDKKIFAAAKSSIEGRSLYKLYLKENSRELAEKLLLFVLYYMKTGAN